MKFIARYDLPPALLVVALALVLFGLSFVPDTASAHGGARHAVDLIRLLTEGVG
jgi:hypothetical protein